MPKANEARTSALNFDGAIPFVVNSPILTLHTAQTDQGAFVAPCDGEIVAATVRMTEACGTGPGTFDVGNQTSDTALATKSFATTDAAGEYDLLPSFTETTVTKGDIILFSTDGGATTTGLAAGTLVISPNAA